MVMPVLSWKSQGPQGPILAMILSEEFGFLVLHVETPGPRHVHGVPLVLFLWGKTCLGWT